ncbi:MAG: hypothetical protein ACRDT6_00030 [Micromonosporaceae bacterium]
MTTPDTARRLATHLFGPGPVPLALLGVGTSGSAAMECVRAQVDRVERERRDTQMYARAQIAGTDLAVVLEAQGAPAVADILAMLAASSCRRVLFLGFAKSLRAAEVGDLIVPTAAVPLDGFTNWFDPGVPTLRVPTAADDLARFLEHQGAAVTRGLVASVPCVFHNHPKVHERLDSGDIDLIEMELASALWAGQQHGIEIVPLLVVSDTTTQDLISGFARRGSAYQRALTLLLDSIRQASIA